tara:strand:+ start:198 stop:425 length:228 start_codon:yes stop_codon:yes gene_type:complete
MRRKGLKKYDAPLRIQFEWGYEAFSKGGSFNRKGHYMQMVPNMDPNTMQYREWQRGWDTAYFENLEKLNGSRTRC